MASIRADESRYRAGELTVSGYNSTLFPGFSSTGRDDQFCCAPPHEASTIESLHEVFRYLKCGEIRHPMPNFVAVTARMRRRLQQAQHLWPLLQRQPGSPVSTPRIRQGLRRREWQSFSTGGRASLTRRLNVWRQSLPQAGWVTAPAERKPLPCSLISPATPAP